MVLLNLHKKMISIRKKYSTLREGSVEFIWTNYGFLSYGRWDKSAKIVVAINNNAKPMEVSLPVWKVGISGGYVTELIKTGGDNFQETTKRYFVSLGELKITVPIFGSVVLVQS
jgi:alpha-glucosidase